MQPLRRPAPSSHPLPWRAGAGALLGAIALTLLVVGAQPGGAATPSPTSTPTTASTFNGIDVVQVTGLLDPPNASLIRDSIHAAERRHSTALVMQMDSGGVVDTDSIALAAAIRAARIPVVVWVGPAGAQVRGGAALVAESAAWVSLASNAHIGPIRPLRLDAADPASLDNARLQSITGRRLDTVRALSTRKFGASQAKTARVVDAVDPVLGDLIVALDGKVLRTATGPSPRLSTAEVTTVAGGARRRPNQDVRFEKLSLVGQFQHTLGAPWAAYFLLAVGAALVVFEFFTISVGIAGVVGAVCLVFACFGFSHLPVHWWAVALILLAFVGFAIDVQAGGLGPWTVIGVVSLVAGSLTLYGGSSEIDPAWWIIVLVCLGVIAFMLGGMTAMLRSRFGTPTLGREGMIGELGLAEVDIAPDGVVRVREALWRARTNRATPVQHGDVVRVVAVEGLVLEVEPETGGAKDHRDRARSRS